MSGPRILLAMASIVAAFLAASLLTEEPAEGIARPVTSWPPATCPTAPPGSVCMLYDDFTTYDTQRWQAIGSWCGAACQNNPANQCFVVGNVTVANGNLVTTATYNPRTAGTCPTDWDAAAQGGEVATIWDGAAVQARTFNFTYGYTEMRVKFAGAANSYITHFLHGANCQGPGSQVAARNLYLPNTADAAALPPGTCYWPNEGSGETDFAEINGNGARQNDTALYNQALQNSTFFTVSPDSQLNYHVYAVDWRPGSMKYYVDGALVWTQTSAQVPSTPMFPIWDTVALATATNFASYPSSSYADYIEIYCPPGVSCTVAHH